MPKGLAFLKMMRRPDKNGRKKKFLVLPVTELNVECVQFLLDDCLLTPPEERLESLKVACSVHPDALGLFFLFLEAHRQTLRSLHVSKKRTEEERAWTIHKNPDFDCEQVEEESLREENRRWLSFVFQRTPPLLEKLALEGFSFGSLAWDFDMQQLFGGKASVEKISLASCFFRLDVFDHLTRSLQSCSPDYGLKSLTLSKCFVPTNKHEKPVLFPFLENLPIANLEHIRLVSPRPRPGCLKSVEALLRNMPKVKSIALINWDGVMVLEPEAEILSFLEKLAERHLVKILKLYNCGLNTKRVSHFLEACVRRKSQVEEMLLQDDFDVDSVWLQHIPSLHYLRSIELPYHFAPLRLQHECLREILWYSTSLTSIRPVELKNHRLSQAMKRNQELHRTKMFDSCSLFRSCWPYLLEKVLSRNKDKNAAFWFLRGNACELA